MFTFNNSIVPNKVRIGWHFSSNKYAYRDVYSALKSTDSKLDKHITQKINKANSIMAVIRRSFTTLNQHIMLCHYIKL